jgi:heme/copper-type cytochrome/quinol oxidase subunit 1
VVLLLGTVLLALPDLISGFLDQPVGLLPGESKDGVEALNALALVGGVIVVLGVLLVVVNVIAGCREARW